MPNPNMLCPSPKAFPQTMVREILARKTQKQPKSTAPPTTQFFFGT